MRRAVAARSTIQPRQTDHERADNADDKQSSKSEPYPLLCCVLLHHAALQFVSTGIAHSSSSHSGTYTRLRLLLHQRFSSTEKTYSDFSSRRRATSASNSVRSAGMGLRGWPHLGLPRLRFHAGTGTRIMPDHTLSAGRMWASVLL